MTLPNTTSVFHRNIVRSYPIAVSGEGAVVIDHQGRKFLDGAGGAFVAILGHNPREVAEAIATQVRTLNFAYTGDFTTPGQERLAEQLIAIAPPGFARVWLTTSGSTANETAMKLARQYHVLRDRPEKTKVISRWHSYHGSTIGALSMTGTPVRRRPYEPYLLAFPHVSPPYCYRCPLGLDRRTCEIACAEEIERVIRLTGAQYVSAVILEPVAGGPLGALPTPPEYLQRVRQICDRYDVLLICDEVVSGMGRTGTWFGVEESGVIPDIVTIGKGLGGGFIPIGAVLVHGRIYKAFEELGTSFVHGESFTGHVLLGATAKAVIDFIDDHQLLDRVKRLGERLVQRLRPLAHERLVGEIRGRGLLYGVEIVRDKQTKEPFPRDLQVSERVVQATARRDVLLLSGNGAADGINGDTILIAPPYVIAEEQLDTIVDSLTDSLREVASEFLD
jgi:adenosylmethionine-8-amino-7-oxononanoate aminotransferase